MASGGGRFQNERDVVAHTTDHKQIGLEQSAVHLAN